MFLHKKGARQPGSLNPDNWAMDAYAFSIEANRVFMSRLFMNLATNIPHYPEWNAYLKDRQPKTLIVWGRNDPLIWPAAAEFVKKLVPMADLRRDCRGNHRDVLPIGPTRSGHAAWFRESRAFPWVHRHILKSQKCQVGLKGVRDE